MPVITPAFPAMCSTHTITPSTKQIMMEEFVRADAIVRGVYDGQKSWTALFDHHSFFTKDHKYYLSVIAASRTKEADSTFHGLVHARSPKDLRECTSARMKMKSRRSPKAALIS
jgi:poly(A) polymerase